MRIVFFSDLHLDDKRNSDISDRKRLDFLSQYIPTLKADAVVNLGDTVSRAGCLRDGTSGGEKSFIRYKAWRDKLNIPFFECGLMREKPFFKEIFEQDIDSVAYWENCAIITLCPEQEYEHLMTDEQMDFLDDAITGANAGKVVICSHTPFPGSCSRPEGPGVFMDTPAKLINILERHAAEKELFWAGGHFHWELEEPRKKYGVTAFMGGRFRFDESPEEHYSYMRLFDDGKIIDLKLTI